LRVLDFSDVNVDNTYVKVVATTEGIFLKKTVSELA
jgi:hypothetical protein